jgi:hypothetical protein
VRWALALPVPETGAFPSRGASVLSHVRFHAKPGSDPCAIFASVETTAEE